MHAIRGCSEDPDPDGGIAGSIVSLEIGKSRSRNPALRHELRVELKLSFNWYARTRPQSFQAGHAHAKSGYSRLGTGRHALRLRSRGICAVARERVHL